MHRGTACRSSSAAPMPDVSRLLATGGGAPWRPHPDHTAHRHAWRRAAAALTQPGVLLRLPAPQLLNLQRANQGGGWLPGHRQTGCVPSSVATACAPSHRRHQSQLQCTPLAALRVVLLNKSKQSPQVAASTAPLPCPSPAPAPPAQQSWPSGWQSLGAGRGGKEAPGELLQKPGPSR